MKRKNESELADLNYETIESSSNFLDHSGKTERIFNPLESSPKFRGSNSSRHNKIRGTYIIYTMNTLPDLIQEIRKSSNEEKIVLRFVLTPEYELLFAREGIPNSLIPPHFAMTGMHQNGAQCKTAGTIKLNKDDGIVEICHQSGCFEPSWDSLQYGLFALLACNAKFENNLQIKKYDGTEWIKFDTNLDSLKKEIDGIFTNEQKEHCAKVNEKLDNRTHEYPLMQSYITSGRTFFAPDKPNCSINLFAEKRTIIKFEL